MLVEFRVENHRSLRDEQVFSMEAGRVGDAADPRPRKVEGHAESLLPVGVLYGANAGGKSNVLDAVRFMRAAVLNSQRAWSPAGGVPRDPFAWGPKRTEPSLFEVTMLLQGVRYEYGFTALDDRFLEEWLHAWPLGKKQVWFERDGDSFHFGDHLKGENKVIEGITRPNALFLSAAVQLKHNQLQPIYTWFRNLQVLNIRSSPWISHRTLPDKMLAGLLDYKRLFPAKEMSHSLLDRFRDFLKSADFGILDVRVDNNDDEEPSRASRYRGVQLKHQFESEGAWLPLEEESSGTRTLFQLGLPILRAIEAGETIFVDELESSLHPMLAAKLVEQFNDPKTNPRNAQLIFTTHDTNLLGTTFGEPILRRDQVWLAEKTSEGATVLYPLTDYKPRKAENLERGYLQGRYGAIPFLGDFSIGGA